MGRLAWRLILCLPALGLALSGILVVAIAPLAWGEGATIGLADWAPPLTAFLIGIPPFVIGILCLKSVLHRTSEDFEFSGLQFTGALILFMVVMTAEVGVAGAIADGAYYASLRDQEGDPTLTTLGVVIYSTLGALLLSSLLAAAAYVFGQAITVVTHRFDRRPDEPDAMKIMMRGRTPRA